ncbi:MAG: KH domain-containing protein [Pyrinomonadaceae bacterium]|nr:KH domain-containing protein [Pyrinomonadaceae bacterium]
MKEAVEMIVKALVNEPERVEVREAEGERGTVMIEVRVAQEDVGKVIGRQGSTIRALRSVLHAAGMKHNRRFVLDVVE